ncbi:heavy-metal-associated domain-containing protein [Halomicrococcus sp. NG-SE-24]|uniref:heavy-metal-associated domain-containing protein n=1 Tax=unclassified Halomicrococcus TaxID=2614448 RepID=UPI003D951298
MTTELTVEGMSCGGCEQTVVSALEEMENVESATADNEADRVTVEGNPDADAVAQTIEDAGYTVKR